MVLNNRSKPGLEKSQGAHVIRFHPSPSKSRQFFSLNEFNRKTDAILAGDTKLGLVNSLGGRLRILIPKDRKWAQRSQGYKNKLYRVYMGQRLILSNVCGKTVEDLS